MDVQAALKGQYHAALAMLHQEIERCPEDLWVSGQHPRNYWRIVYHTLFYTHLYLMPTVDDFVPWRLNRQHSECLYELDEDSNEMPPEDPPYSREELLEYCQMVDALVDPGVDRLDLDATTCGIPWYNMSKLEHQMLNIRHAQGHVGQLSELCLAAGVDLDWAGSRKAMR